MIRDRLFCRVLACTVLAAALYSFPSCADISYSEDSTASVEDIADVLTEEEEEALLEQATELAQMTGMEFRVVTTDDADGKSASSYAEDYFEDLAQDYAGGCYLLDLDNREYYVATYGDLRYILTDDRIDTLVSNAGSYARSSDWEGTLSSMMSDTKTYIQDGVQEGTALYDVETGEYTFYEPPKAISPFEALMSGGIGILGFLSMFLTTKRRYQMKVPERNDYRASENVHLNLRVKQDHLINRHVSRRLIPRDNDHHGSGGGGASHISSVHTTSGGHSAGGGGGKF